MKVKVSRFLSGMMAVLLLVVFCVPAFAALPDYSGAVTGFWDKILYNYVQGVSSDFLLSALGVDDVAQGVAGLVCDQVCISSPDAVHHATSVEGGQIATDSNGRYTLATCIYCHDRFKVYASDLKQSYENQVQELPATGYTSAGKLIYQFCVSDIVGSFQFVGRTFDSISAFPVTFNDGVVSFSCFNDSTLYMCYDNRSGSGSNWNTFSFSSNLCVPIEGSYVRILSPLIEYRYLLETGFVSGKRSYTASSKSPHYYFLEDTISFSFSESAGFSSRYVELYAHLPVYEITLSNNTLFSSTYNINTRPTSIMGGNYGIVGENGTINTVTNNNKIVNETNNTYYNPATGQSSTITDWSYNYDGRIYNLTLDTGDTVNVEYGDENITIIEGDTTYIIYYMMDGSGASHTHDWVQTGAKQGTCLSPAQRTYTCIVCNEQYTETDPAPGHSWRAIRTVPTTYDEDGNLTQEGYTIYECERCDEQYKSTNITGPPFPGSGGSGGTDNDGESIWDKIGNFFGTIFKGIFGMIEAVIGKILDGLITLGEMLMEKLTAVVEVVLTVFDEVPKLFGGFLDFLGVVFPYLPSEITLLLTFGIIAVVFIGIIKALRR